MIAEYFIDKGQKSGQIIGQKMGEISMLINQLYKRFKINKDQISPKLNQLESNDLLELGELIIDHDSADSIFAWIDQRIKIRSQQLYRVMGAFPKSRTFIVLTF